MDRLDPADHGALTGLSDAHAHSIYKTLAQAIAWHDALVKKHLTSALTHDHSDSGAGTGKPVRKLRSGTYAQRGAVKNTGDVYVASDQKTFCASIPAVVPAESIYGESYLDGGVYGASPLTIMQEPILHRVHMNCEALHINYINSIDLSVTNQRIIHTVVDNWRQASSDLIRSSTVIDRLQAYELLRCHSGNLHKEKFVCNYENLQHVKQIRAIIKYSLLEIYPLKDCDINITKFSGEDVVCGIRNAYKKCACRFYWLEPEDQECVIKVKSLISVCSSCD